MADANTFMLNRYNKDMPLIMIKSLFKVAGESTNIGNDKNNNNNENNDRKSINNYDDNNDDDKTTRSLVLAAWNENQKDEFF